jgi:hypothetical protein
MNHNQMHSLLYILIIGSRQFSRTVHVCRLPRKGSTITINNYKFKVIAENQNIDMYDDDQTLKTDKSPESVILVLRNIAENSNIIEIQNVIRLSTDGRKTRWEEEHVTSENERLVGAVSKKNHIPVRSAQAMDWIMLCIMIASNVFFIFELTVSHIWIWGIGVAFCSLLLFRAQGKDSVFQKK